jgi:DNA-directed RNA polymerase specialized sigma subunit
MQIIENYADLLRQISIIETQLEMYQKDVDYWLGKGIPLAGKGSAAYGMDTAAMNVDRLHKKINELNEMLDYYQEIQKELHDKIYALEGLPFVISRMRFLEDMTYQEIAEELDLTYGYVRQVVSKSNKERTAILKNP